MGVDDHTQLTTRAETGHAGDESCPHPHEPQELTLVNALGGKCGKVYQCPECEEQLLQTKGLLVGGEKMLPLNQVERI